MNNPSQTQSGGYAQQPMSVSLTDSAEVPPVSTSATGSRQITVLPDDMMSASIKVSGLVSDGFTVPAWTRLTDSESVGCTSGDLYISVFGVPCGRTRLSGSASAGLSSVPCAATAA